MANYTSNYLIFASLFIKLHYSAADLDTVMLIGKALFIFFYINYLKEIANISKRVSYATRNAAIYYDRLAGSIKTLDIIGASLFYKVSKMV